MSDLKQVTKPEARSTRKLAISSLDRAVFKEPYAREVRTHTNLPFSMETTQFFTLNVSASTLWQNFFLGELPTLQTALPTGIRTDVVELRVYEFSDWSTVDRC